MIIRGSFAEGAPYIFAGVRGKQFAGPIQFLVDTDARFTVILDRDTIPLGIQVEFLRPSQTRIIGIGGTVATFQMKDVELVFPADIGELKVTRDI